MKKILAKSLLAFAMAFGAFTASTPMSSKTVEAEEEPQITGFRTYNDWYAVVEFNCVNAANVSNITGTITNANGTSTLQKFNRDGNGWQISASGSVKTGESYTGNIIVTDTNDNSFEFNISVTEGSLTSQSYVAAVVENTPKALLGVQKGAYAISEPINYVEGEGEDYQLTTKKYEGAQYQFCIKYDTSKVSLPSGAKAKFDYSNLKAGDAPYVSQGDPVFANVNGGQIDLYCRKDNADFSNVSGTGVVTFNDVYKFTFVINPSLIDAETNAIGLESYSFASVATATAVRFSIKTVNVDEQALANYSEVAFTVKVGEKQKEYISTTVFTTLSGTNGTSDMSSEGNYYCAITFTGVPEDVVFTVSAIIKGNEGTDDILTKTYTYTVATNNFVAVE